MGKDKTYGEMAMNYALEINIPLLPKIITNGSHGSHWAATAEKKKWRTLIALHVGRQGPVKPLERAKVECVRRSSSEPDFDNLAASFKRVIDALVNCGVIENDKQTNIGQPVYLWEKASPKKGSITVKVAGL